MTTKLETLGRRRAHPTVAMVLLSVVASYPGHGREPADLGPELEAIRAASNLPALVGAIFSPDEILARGVAGERARDSGSGAQIDDLWHIGSITKSFTATLAARLVENGELTWTAPLGELLPTLLEDSPYATRSLPDLLSHQSGLPANLSPAETRRLVNLDSSVREQRLAVVETVVAETPGTGFLYSNAGYVSAGAALEVQLDDSWENLLREHVLEPLELSSAGFGPPGEMASDGGANQLIDQPRGHRRGNDGVNRPVEPGPWADNPPFLGPAGTLHLTISDLARYAQEHLRGELGTSLLLEPETFRFLHQPQGDAGDSEQEGGGYALGWVVEDQDWAGGRTIWHNGSNTMWYALVVLIPERSRGIALATNVMDREPIHAALGELMEPWWP